MYGIFANIYHENQPNVGKYTIHGWHGKWTSPLKKKMFEKDKKDKPPAFLSFQDSVPFEGP